MKNGGTPKTSLAARWWLGYVVAIAGTIVAALARGALGWKLGDLTPYITFYPVPFAAAMAGGTWPGLLATALSIFAADVFFMEPRGTVGPATVGQAVEMALFIAINVAISILAGQLRAKSKASRESEARLWRLIDSAPVPIAMFDKEMRYLAVSRRWVENFGASNQSVIGRCHYEVDRQIPERWKQVHRRCLAGAVERAEEDVFENPDGRRQWVRWEVQPWYAAPGVVGGIVIFSEDITDRKNAAEGLRESEERFRTMANAIPQPAWIARPDGYVFWYNRRAYEYTGATPEQLEGWAWQSFHDPEVLPRVLERWHRSLATGEPFDMEFPIRGADGRYRTFLTRVMPVKDGDGRVSLWFGTHTDITEQKNAEADLERKVKERTAKLREVIAELEYMSYSMVHDMRAPLRAMRGFAELLQQDSEECRRPPASNYLGIIHESCYRLDRLVTGALNYNKIVGQNVPLRPVDLGELLRGMVQTYPNLQAAEISVEFAELVVLGNESLLTQCFGNLLDNAVKFVAEGVEPRVRVWAELSVINNQPATSICVEDNGIGIPEEAQEGIFRMFQRMHAESEYPGTGIGLAIVRKAVERMNGRISINSEPGKGTRFQIELPRPVKSENEAPVQAAA